MLPYNQVSFLSNSDSGKFDSYLGFMDMNQEHVSSCLEEEYIEDGSRFVAVSHRDTGRSTTVFHIVLSELEKIKNLSDIFSQDIEECEFCGEDHKSGGSLFASTFAKSATLHGDTEICQNCLEELESALELEDRTLESELVKQTI